MEYLIIMLFLPLCSFSQTYQAGAKKMKKRGTPPISYEEMQKLADLPLHCVDQEYPNKLNQVLVDSTHLKSPKDLHPVFYGCFDWHSACHGFWLLTKAMNTFPKTELEKKVIQLLDSKLTEENIAKELDYFKYKLNQSFERTYGWAWLLKFYAELDKSPLNKKHKWTTKLEPLKEHIVNSYHQFLPKLVYPIRVGEHTNTAFGLTLAYEYALQVKDDKLKELIKIKANEFYGNDEQCPIGWEPSGFDFISPCLQEAHLMSLVLSQEDFLTWLNGFLPELLNPEFKLEPGKVLDRTDGKLVHLDGLNFSRAWCLYQIAKSVGSKAKHLTKLADQHISASYDHVVGSDYMGSHWLASFLVYALFIK